MLCRSLLVVSVLLSACVVGDEETSSEGPIAISAFEGDDIVTRIVAPSGEVLATALWDVPSATAQFESEGVTAQIAVEGQELSLDVAAGETYATWISVSSGGATQGAYSCDYPCYDDCIYKSCVTCWLDHTGNYVCEVRGYGVQECGPNLCSGGGGGGGGGGGPGRPRWQ